MMQNRKRPNSLSPTRPAAGSDQPSAHAAADEELTPAQRNFAEVVGRLLARQWEREQPAPSPTSQDVSIEEQIAE